jgi:hypothetical protein
VHNPLKGLPAHAQIRAGNAFACENCGKPLHPKRTAAGHAFVVAPAGNRPSVARKWTGRYDGLGPGRNAQDNLNNSRNRPTRPTRDRCKSPEEYKAWSRNLGHENVLTTFSNYGDVARHRQAEIIRALGKSEQHACISSSSLIVLPAKAIFDGATSMIRARL